MQPIFTRDDVKHAHHQLVRLLRLIIYKRKLTFNDYTRFHNLYAHSIGMSVKDASTDRSNHWKTLLKLQGISFHKFIHIVTMIFKDDIIRFSITTRNPTTGLETTYNSDDPVD